MRVECWMYMGGWHVHGRCVRRDGEEVGGAGGGVRRSERVRSTTCSCSRVPPCADSALRVVGAALVVECAGGRQRVVCAPWQQRILVYFAMLASASRCYMWHTRSCLPGVCLVGVWTACVAGQRIACRIPRSPRRTAPAPLLNAMQMWRCACCTLHADGAAAGGGGRDARPSAPSSPTSSRWSTRSAPTSARSRARSLPRCAR